MVVGHAAEDQKQIRRGEGELGLINLLPLIR